MSLGLGIGLGIGGYSGETPGPVNTVAPVISGTVERGETLSSTTGTWSGTGPITYAYQWKRDGVNIAAATSSTYVLVAADDNAYITCLVSATDDNGTRNKISNTLGPVLGAPLNLTAPVLSGTETVGETLSVTTGTWQGVTPISYTYQWRRDGGNIPGATSSSYTLVAADYNTVIDCVVTATNTIDSTTQDSNDTGAIVGTAPVISGVPTISGTEQVGETLTATAASVTGTPTPSRTWQWQRSVNGTSGWTNISAATSSTYTLVAADENQYIRVVQTETNLYGSDTANSAATGQIAPETSFLLDTYTGAAAAYSLRQLRTGVTNVVRIRRSSDNTEADFTATEVTDGTLTTWTGANDGFVVTWYDQSTNSNDATQSTAGAQGQIVSSGSLILNNSLPTVNIAANTQHYVISGVQASTVFVVGEKEGTTISSYIAWDTTNSIGAYMGRGTGTSGAAGIFDGIAKDGPDVTGQKLVYWNYTGTNYDIGTNGATVTNLAAGSQGTFNQIMGRSLASPPLSLNGNIQEMIMWTTDESSDRTGIETDINNHYSIY